jgi:predicted metal-binding membrane protein
MQTIKSPFHAPYPAAFLSASVVVFAVATAGTIHFCRSMAGGMDMPGGWTMSMMWMPMPGYAWTGSAAMFLLMWFVMMVAMMLPSALPMLLNLQQPSNKTKSFATLALSATTGYFFIWTLIGVGVYVIGVAFALATMHLDWLSRITPALSGAMLIICGIVQLTPWKINALHRCRAPDCGALQEDGTLGNGWRYGFKQGMLCCICCAAPMLALLVLGAMNLAVMTIIAAVITIEKLLPYPERTVRIFGIIALLAGTFALIRAVILL